jgi:HPr kinase/phosphorylase
MLHGATSLIHATCIALQGRAALLTGPSGAGKSDLALRCLTSGSVLGDRPLRASLVADDYVVVERQGNILTVRAPEQIRGKLEVRGLGIIDVPHTVEAELTLIVKLVASGQVYRLPDPQTRESLLGVAVPVLHVAALEASAPEKVLIALAGRSG